MLEGALALKKLRFGVVHRHDCFVETHIGTVTPDVPAKLGEAFGLPLPLLIMPDSTVQTGSGDPLRAAVFFSNGCRTQFNSSLIASWGSNTEQTQAQGASEPI